MFCSQYSFHLSEKVHWRNDGKMNKELMGIRGNTSCLHCLANKEDWCQMSNVMKGFKVGRIPFLAPLKLKVLCSVLET